MTREEAVEIMVLKREKIISTISSLPQRARERSGLHKEIEAYTMSIEALEKPEIVHCKDCKYWIRTRIGEEELNQCGLAGYLIGGRGYCLYGKEGDQE